MHIRTSSVTPELLLPFVLAIGYLSFGEIFPSFRGKVVNIAHVDDHPNYVDWISSTGPLLRIIRYSQNLNYYNV